MARTPTTRRTNPISILLGRRARHERGAATVEFAIILPILILLIFGIVEFGRAYNAKVALTHGVREGVRVLALDSGDPVTTTKDAAPSLKSGLMAVSPSAQPCSPGTNASVTATYPITYDIPLFGSKTITLSSTGVMRCGG